MNRSFWNYFGPPNGAVFSRFCRVFAVSLVFGAVFGGISARFLAETCLRSLGFTSQESVRASWFAESKLRAEEPGQLQFNRDIRPILSEACFACHGFDDKKRQGDLRLDTPEGATADLGGHAAVKPGDLAASELWKRITSTDPDAVMPPPTSKHQLTDEQKQKLKVWIEQGANYQRHWAFEPLSQVQPPTGTDWSDHPVDRFLLKDMQQRGLQPLAEADRFTLIRRVAFTLTGLPPTPAEVKAFVEDRSSHAYEDMVERYLASERYGEEMAKHWLDVARYADTHGLHLDNERAMWAYRDWVIKAFNENQPFDQFTINQLAGDLLPNPTQDQLVATGFNRCNVTTSEGGAINEEFLFRYAVDRASTTIQAWMGMTGGCAVCHSHKYDPLSMKEFYSFYAFFYSAADPAMDGNSNTTPPLLKLTNPQRDSELVRWKQLETDRVAALQRWIDAGLYQDPATMAEKPAAREVRDLWLDDRFPDGAGVSCSSRNPSMWISADEGLKPASGLRALKQVSAVNYEDRIDQPNHPWIVPADGKLHLFLRVDPKSVPEALMLEVATTSGGKKLLWGAVDRYGGADENNRIRLGDVPASGDWVEVVFEVSKWGLPAGTQVNNLKLAQYGGVAYWDKIEMVGTAEPASDLRHSLNAWWDSRKGKDTRHVDGNINKVLKEGREANPTPENQTAIRNHFLHHIARGGNPEHEALLMDVREAKDHIAWLEENRPATFVFADLGSPRQAFMMERGQYDKPGEQVEPNTPAFLPPLKGVDGRRATRLDLARWLVSDEHPLTPRVTVNRFWQQVFGTGLVKTSYDFGSQGDVPSHPELLDWLARWYQANDWDTKALMRLLVNSSAFKQQGVVTPALLAADAENRYLARGPRMRLDAEQIRDNVLFVSGLIDFTIGGPGFKSYQPPNIWEPVGYADSNTRFYLQDHGSNLYRRSVYAFFKRTAPPPFMSNFDAPNREQFCTVRERSNTPLQALQLMNDVQHFEAARAFGERMLKEGGSSAEERILFAYRVALAREPRDAEQKVLLSTLQKFVERYQADPAAAEAVVANGESEASPQFDKRELAAYTMLGNLILNLDETIYRN